jgi:hypothetical protein
MSWTPTQFFFWQSSRNTLEERFNNLKDQYVDTIQKETGNVTKLNFIASQMTATREELSRVSIIIKDALEDLRSKGGNIDEPIRLLEKEQEILRIEYEGLERRGSTRKEQVASLNSRTEENRHTIGFLMMKPLQNPTAMIIISTVLALLSIGMNYSLIRNLLQSQGVLTIRPEYPRIVTRART